MPRLNFFPPLFFAFVLIFAQHGGVMHALGHIFTEQAQNQGKQSPYTHDCEECSSFAQLGGALNSGYISFELHAWLLQTLAPQYFFFSIQHSLPASARGPPLFQQSI